MSETISARLDRIKAKALKAETFAERDDAVQEVKIVCLLHGTVWAAQASNEAFDFIYNAPEEMAHDFLNNRGVDPYGPASGIKAKEGE
jgi:hypothetical protein